MRFIITVLLLLVGGAAAAQSGCGTLALPVSEAFDSYGDAALPPCWYATRNYDVGSAPHIDSSRSNSGTASLVLYPGTLAGSHYSMAIAPPLEVDSMGGLQLRFMMLATSTAARLEVGLCEDTLRQTRAFVALDTMHVDQSGRWQEVTVDLGRYAGTGRRLAFRMQRGLQADAAECYIDDITIESCGISEVGVSHIGSTSLTLTFTTYGNGAVQVAYGDTTVLDAVSPLTVTGLQPQTAYTFAVGCTGGVQHSVSATTMAGASLVPAYYETFSGGLPSGWLFPTGSTPTVSSGRLQLTPTAGDSCVAVLPLQDVAATSDLSITLLLTGSGTTQLLVGVMEYAGEPESFVPVDTLACTTAQVRHTVSLANYSGTGGYIALVAKGSGTVTVDEVRVARCLLADLTPYDLTESAVTVAWDTLVLSGAVQMEYGSRGFTMGQGTRLLPATNPYTLEGLAMGSDYDLYLWPTCGDSVCSYDKLQFSTFAHRVLPPYCTDFEESASLPQGWVGTSATISGNSYSGNRALRLAAGGRVCLPLLDTASADTLVLEFYASGSGTLTIGTAVSAYATPTTATTLTGGTWRHYSVQLAGVAGRCITLSASGAWNIDALSLHVATVLSASVSRVGQQTATLHWTLAGADSAQVEYCQVASAYADFTDGVGTAVVNADSLVLSGLQAGSHYAVHLRPQSDSAGCYPMVLHLQTLPDSVALPYCENFEGIVTSGYPELWRRRSGMGEYPLVSTERNNTGSRSLHLAATATLMTTAMLPDAIGCSGHRMLAFWTNMTSAATGAMLIVGGMSDIDDESTFEGIDTILLSAVEQWKHHEVVLPAMESHLVLRLVGGNIETHLFIDDLCLDACAARNVSLGSVQQSSATLTWTGEGVSGVVAHISGAISRKDTFYTSPDTIVGLSEDNRYVISVEALCDCGGSGVAYAYGGASNGNAANRRVSFSLNTLPSQVSLPVCSNLESYSTGSYPWRWRRRGTVAVSDLNYYSGGHSLAADSASSIIFPQLSADGRVVVSFQVYSSAAAALGDSAILVGVTGNPDSVASMTVVDSIGLDALGQWQYVAVDLGNAADSGSFVAVRCNAAMYIDDLSVARFGIGDPTVSESGAVSWQQWGCSRVAIEYGPAGFTPGSGTADTADASPFTPVGLDLTQSYDFYLTPLSGTTAACHQTKVSMGSSTAVPYCENFDLTPTGGMPQEWNIGRTHGGTPSIYVVDGQKTLYMQATATSRSITVLPKLATDSVERLLLSMSLRSSNSNRAMLLVGEIGNAADPNTFIARDTLTCTASGVWQTRRLRLSRFDGSGRIALACQATTQTAEMWVDSIAVIEGEVPTLSAVSARRVEVLYAGGGAGWIEYDTAGFTQGDGTVVRADASHSHIDGLTPGRTYWFYCRSDSSEATCLAPLEVGMPTEVSLPYCYQRDTLEQMILPEFDIDSIGHLHLYLDLYTADNVVVGVMERRGEWASLTAVDTLGAGSHHVTFDEYDGSGRFVALTSTDNFVVDNLRATACPLPTVTLEDDGSVMLRGSGVVEYDGVRVAVGDSLRLTTLEDTTEYAFYPLCTMTDVVCGEPIRLATSMTVGLPYCVELADSLPAGWAVENGAATVAGGVLTMSEGTRLKLPIMPVDEVAVEYERLTADGWQRVQYTAQGRLTLQADSDGVSLRHLTIDRCLLPDRLGVSQTAGGVVSVRWEESYSNFYIGYRLVGDSVTTFVAATAPPLTLAVLTDTVYEFTIACDTLHGSCRTGQTVRTLAASTSLPYCHDFDTFDLAALPQGWLTEVSEGSTYIILPQPSIDSLRHLNISLTARGSQQATLGVMSDAGDLSTFDSLTTFALTATGYTSLRHVLSNYYGNGRFLALRLADTTAFALGRVVVGSCVAYDVTIVEHEADHVVFEWQQQGEPTVSIEYGQQGFAAGSGITVQALSSPYRIDSLSPLTNYAFYVSSGCPSQDSLCQTIPIVDTFNTFTPQGGTGCIDYTDLLAAYVTCSSGSYSSPTQYNGAIDYGYLSAASRHTVHYDTTERDPRTGGLLRTVPEGSDASVRLGNWLTGGSAAPEAESLTYALNVDSGDVDLLILQYAAVLQDAEHSPSLQPRFRLEILNASGTLIDSCGMADFIANANLGWNEAANDVLWKDWTTVGLDLTPYAGQTIFIRLTTYDCGEGSHYGYAYFTLHCATKRMATEGCSTVPTYRFTVPNGFSYRWYTNQSDSTISSERSILVPSDNDVTYYCQLSAIDNAECSFMMSAFAGARYPLALFDTALSLANCQFTLQLTDRSTISFDGVNPVGTGEPCETLMWLLPGGDTSTAAQPTVTLDDSATVDITLIAGIASNQCVDTLTQRISIQYPYPHATLTGDTARCYNDDSTLLTLHHAATYSWADTALFFAPAADTTVSAVVVDTNGCTDTLRHTLVVHPIYDIADSDTVCSSNLTYAWRDTSMAFTIADSAVGAVMRRQTAYGCDSVMTLALSLWPSYDLHHSDSICTGDTLPFLDTVLATAGSHLHSDTTLHGCDSLVTMQLTLMPVYTMNDARSVCDSLRWRDDVLYTADTTGAADSLTTAFGCDSVIVLTLNVHPSHHLADSDTVCSSNLTYAWRDTTVTFTIADSAVDAMLRRQTAYGCDSTMTLALALWPSYDLHHADTVCDDAPPTFFDSLLTAMGEYLHSDSTLYGCDSLVTMHLVVYPTFHYDDPHTVCDSLRWIDGRLYVADTAGATDTLGTVHGCDSVMTLLLTVHPSYLHVDRDTFCEGNTYLFRDMELTAGGLYGDTLYSIYGCDSVMSIDLYERPAPHATIRVERDCEHAWYELHAEVDVPFVGWQWGLYNPLTPYRTTDSVVYINPDHTTSYILCAAYDDWPQCMSRDTVTLDHFEVPQALLRVMPQSVTPENPHFDAYDYGWQWDWRRWYIDSVMQEETSFHLEGDAVFGDDTLWVSLVVGTEYCADTATQAVVVRDQALYKPNVFTPGGQSNNEFYIVGVHIAAFEIDIFNRAGVLVFHADDINSPWDGRNLTGEPCPTGNYVYRIRYATIYQPNAWQVDYGSVLLIR